MTIGAHKGVRLPMEGSELPGVLLNIDFLRNASLGQETGMGNAYHCSRRWKRSFRLCENRKTSGRRGNPSGLSRGKRSH